MASSSSGQGRRPFKAEIVGSNPTDATMKVYFEEYSGCSCVSQYELKMKDLLGYCKFHGGDRRHKFCVDITKEQWDQDKDESR